MRRRKLIVTSGAIASAWPLIAHAQSGRLPRLAIAGTVTPESDMVENTDRWWAAFFGRLRHFGYEEGRTLIVDRWSARGNTARFPELAREIANSQPDAIYCGATAMAQALQRATTNIPIVLAGPNLVESGLADRVSRPGRNVTGLSAAFGLQLSVKRLELLREALPAASRIAILMPRSNWDLIDAHQLREAAPRLGASAIGALLDDPVQPPQYRRAFSAMPEQRIDAVFVHDRTENGVHRRLIIELARDNRLPVITPWREATELGGLMSFGMDVTEGARVSVDYIVRVLRGEKPADMPVRLIDKHEFVVNLKTARELGIVLPPAILARADEVIE